MNNKEHGRQGVQGVQGIQGIEGTRGQGEPGEQGPRGERGKEGHHGKAGVRLRTVILIVVIPLFAYLYANSVKTVDTLRAGCERTNVTRTQFVGLLDDIIQVNIARTKAAGTTPSEKAANEQAVEQYSERRDKVLASVDADLVQEGSPAKVDCSAAFPKPWPLN